MLDILWLYDECKEIALASLGWPVASKLIRGHFMQAENIYNGDRATLATDEGKGNVVFIVRRIRKSTR